MIRSMDFLDHPRSPLLAHRLDGRDKHLTLQYLPTDMHRLRLLGYKYLKRWHDVAECLFRVCAHQDMNILTACDHAAQISFSIECCVSSTSWSCCSMWEAAVRPLH